MQPAASSASLFSDSPRTRSTGGVRERGLRNRQHREAAVQVQIRGVCGRAPERMPRTTSVHNIPVGRPTLLPCHLVGIEVSSGRTARFSQQDHGPALAEINGGIGIAQSGTTRRAHNS
jgi:hypothetical protein